MAGRVKLKGKKKSQAESVCCHSVYHWPDRLQEVRLCHTFLYVLRATKDCHAEYKCASGCMKGRFTKNFFKVKRGCSSILFFKFGSNDQMPHPEYAFYGTGSPWRRRSSKIEGQKSTAAILPPEGDSPFPIDFRCHALRMRLLWSQEVLSFY